MNKVKRNLIEKRLSGIVCAYFDKGVRKGLWEDGTCYSIFKKALGNSIEISRTKGTSIGISKEEVQEKLKEYLDKKYLVKEIPVVVIPQATLPVDTMAPEKIKNTLEMWKKVKDSVYCIEHSKESGEVIKFLQELRETEGIIEKFIPGILDKEILETSKKLQTLKMKREEYATKTQDIL